MKPFTLHFILPIFYLFLGFIPFNVHAQLQVSGVPQTIPGAPQSYNQMIQQLFGNGVVVSNLVINCDTAQKQAGWFVATGTNLNLTQGLLLTSGDINVAANANTQSGASGVVNTFGQGNDADLDNISSATTHNSCGIEFDLIPYCDTISLRYVFGSEEYMEFANSSFNDVFGFFITGPNPAGGNYTTFNIAKIPGTTTPVSIDNVNCNFNNTYYVCNEPNTVGSCALPSCPPNSAATTIEYDGFTAVLDAVAAVVPCQSYHIKIAIADAGDGILDSGVFLQAGGVQCSSGLINVGVGNSINAGGNIAVEGCVDGVFTFTLPSPALVNDTFNFVIGGTAQPNGVDYAGTMPTQLIMLAGQTTITVPVPIISDGIPEPVETILLIYIDSSLCGSQVFVDTFTLNIVDNPITDAGPDQSFCSGGTINIGGTSPVGYNYTWSPPAGVSNINNANTTLSLVNTTNAPVTYQYVLTAQALLGVCGATDTVNITVMPAIQADFVSTNACYGANASFNNTSNSPATIFNYDFGVANLTTDISNTANPQYYYPQAGIYNVTLIAVSAFGCKDTVVRPVAIYDKPVADFNTPAVCHHLTTSYFDASPPAISWLWDFGDGTTSTLQNPTHILPNDGNTSTQLIITNSNGCKDTVVKNVFVNTLPSASFSATDGCITSAVNFTYTGTNGTGVVNAYGWDFGDVSGAGSGAPIAHTYPIFGPYNVTLFILDNLGCGDTITQPIITRPLPIPNFTFSNDCEEKGIPFTNTSTVPQGIIASQTWQFGDNLTSTLVAPSHTYQNAGIYPVKLTTTTEYNCTVSIVKDIYIYPRPDIGFENGSVCLGEVTFFTDKTTLAPIIADDKLVSWDWNMGDATTDSNQDPAHLYATSGTYNVVLTVTTDKGCVRTANQNAIVFELPVTPQVVGDTTCFSGDVVLFANTFNATDRIYWYYTPLDTVPFLIGNSYSIQNILVDQVFFVQAIGQGKCVSPKVPIQAHVYPDNPANIVIANTVLETPQAIANLSVTSQIPMMTYLWHFDDKTTSTLPNPSHEYTYPGIYNIEVRCNDENGCAQTLKQQIEVKEVYSVSVPSVFTPNNDNSNDEFYIGDYQIAQFSISIFDRWGGEVFSSTDPKFRWDGRKDGKDLPEGVYVYKINGISSQAKKIAQSGSITLMR
jgi:gliding motility-associated-like protein